MDSSSDFGGGGGDQNPINSNNQPKTTQGETVQIETPKLGMSFKNAEEAFRFYHDYAVQTGFGVKCQYSKYDKEGRCRCIVISCNRDGVVKYKRDSSELTKKTNCKAKIQLGYRDDGLLHVRKLTLEHNHPLFPGKIKNHLTRRTRKRYLYDNDKEELPSRESWVGKRGREAKKCKLVPERADWEAIHRFFSRMQAKDSYFFHLMDWAEDGVLKNVFWADGKSKIAYQYFSDVVLVDSTCLIDKYDVPLVSFVGINHHGQSILLGCGLVSDESTDAYAWLCRSWLACMFGRAPVVIITDRCKSLQDAVSMVFPGSCYRQCLGHIMKRFKENLNELTEIEEFNSFFGKVIFDSIREDDFEEGWRKIMEKFKLENNEWFRSLYNDRCLWAPLFVKNKFCAGLSLTASGDCMKLFFTEHLTGKFTLKQFIKKYETIVQEKYNKELQLDMESLHRTPQLVTKLYIEEQLGKVYTTDIFRQCQTEIRGLIYCISSLTKSDGPIHIFHVKECVRVKDSKIMESKIHEVILHESEMNITCNCNSFEWRGILCRHTLSVICCKNICEIPSKYIMERWRKDYKRMHALSYFPDNDINIITSDGKLEQHENLYRCCLKLSEIGLMSEEKYEFANKVVDEAIRKLLEDENGNSTCEVATNNNGLVGFDASNGASSQMQMGPGQISGHQHFQFFQDRSNVVQETASYRAETEWRLQQFFQESQIGN